MRQRKWIIFLILLLKEATGDGRQKIENGEWYPTYHLAPKSGWMNDPNGLIWFGGYYHAYFQHNPQAPEFRGENMSWGHARSKDMINWEHLPTALSPSPFGDMQGCFSGSAVNDCGILRVIYTGVSEYNSSAVQAQCLASSNDTIHFTKYGKIIEPSINIYHFRDPKVWKENGVWYMVVSSGNQNDLGQILLYKSVNLYQWSFERILVEAPRHLNRFWECPDLFKLGDKHILLFSSQAPTNDSPRNEYFVGQWCPDSGFVRDEKESAKKIDHGHDFYAAQTFLAPDGRRIMIGWLGASISAPPEKKYGWAGMLTIPRELSLLNHNTVAVVPVRELEKLRQNSPFVLTEVILQNQHVKVTNDQVQAAEFAVTWKPCDSDAEEYGLRLGDEARNTDDGLYLYVNTKLQRLILDRRYAQVGVSGNRSIPLPPNKKSLILRVYFDKSSVEVFVNNGEASMTSRIYPTENRRFLTVYAKNGFAKLEGCRLWTLKK